MIDSTNFHLLVASLAWPVVALIAVFAFKKPIVSTLERVIGFKSDLIQVDLNKNPFRGSASRNVHLKLDKAANIYWAASDVMETIMRLLNNTISASFVFLALKQFVHHVEEIGADKIPDVGPRLAEISKRLESMPSADLTPALRQSLVRDLHQIMGAIGANLEAAQPGFK